MQRHAFRQKAASREDVDARALDMGISRMGEAMLPSEPQETTSRVVKAKPQAKLPAAAVLETLLAADVKSLKLVLVSTVEYVPNEFLDRPEAEALLRRPLYAWDDEPTASDDSGVYGLDAAGDVIRALDREHYLFLRFNYCRRRTFQILHEHVGRRLSAAATGELLRWERATAETRGEIVRANIPLVLAMAKRTRITAIDLTDLISEGNLALLRAVNKFDCARGYKFSTYACRAILKSFSRVATRTSRHRVLFPTEFDPALERSDFAERSRASREGECVHELKSILLENEAQLSEVERQVILARFNIDAGADNAAAKAKTLEQVGEMIGVTKERVRQIQNKALGKLRAVLEQTVLAR
jgi:RNA polymerase primary sigma factor